MQSCRIINPLTLPLKFIFELHLSRRRTNLHSSNLFSSSNNGMEIGENISIFHSPPFVSNSERALCL